MKTSNFINCVLESNQSQCLKLFVELNTQKVKAEKHGDNAGKVLYKLMNNAVYGKIIENLRNRIDVRLVSKKKDQLFKMEIKNQAMSQKRFDNDLLVIRKSKVKLTLKKQHMSKYYDDLRKLVIAKMKDETGGVAIKETAGLRSKMDSSLEDDSGQHKKAEGVNKNVVKTISHR